GYRFVASVREVDGASEEVNGISTAGLKVNGAAAVRATNGHQSAAAPAVNEKPEGKKTLNGRSAPRRRGRLIARAALASIAMAAMAVALINRKSQDDSPPPPRKLWQLTFDAGLESEPSWSPDGRMIAYAADRSGNFDIWVQPVGEGNPVRVTTSDA